MLKRLINYGCELQTFVLQENVLRAVTWSIFDYAHHPWREIVASQEVIAAFVELRISRSLAVSIWSSNTEDGIGYMSNKDFQNVIRGFANRLAFEKGMKATMPGPSNKPGFEVRTFMYETIQKSSRCLRQQHSPQQSSKMADTILG